jgi:hypothetical protein
LRTREFLHLTGSTAFLIVADHHAVIRLWFSGAAEDRVRRYR